MKKQIRNGKGFWDDEYREGGHLALSMNPSEDLEKFARWLEREQGRSLLNITSSVLDLGCGNGRNLVWLAETYNMRGIGYDISVEAVAQAMRHATTKHLPLVCEARSIAGVLSVPDASQSLVLDMMTSHFLNATEREVLIHEVFRVLRPGGFLFYKTFLLDEDQHAKRMLKEHPANEPNTYIHPKIGVAEHVSTEDEILETYGALFTIQKIHKSHRHTGKDAKRRSIGVYMQKPEF
jgi:ubiquinone/menaquinone biosynthesis C-methylase UbiE